MEIQTEYPWFVPPPPEWREQFEERYGDGTLEHLVHLLVQPCVTFAAIAEEFGVTRERARQWHLELMPGAPRGHARQRLCASRQSKRRLLEDPLFRSFYEHARGEVESHRFVLVPAREGFRKRIVRLDTRTIGIREAVSRADSTTADQPATYVLTRFAEPVDFIYYRLSARDYLVVPGALVPEGGLEYGEQQPAAFDRFRNTFAAVLRPAVIRQ
ncbi:MAG: hypothetical protein LBQ09_12205 [Acidobacteriaceae bacterium]|jgi:transposase-like protein|nr:hypothetical protein [Acidobacteriaceae bacterium]